MLQPGDRIDIWVIEKRLGSGGMGSVYRCHNHAASRILAAIKVLDGQIARHPEARARFVREAEILFTLDHPNIVKVRNIRVEGDTPYIEMEFVQGESLEDRLGARGGLPLEEALPIFAQIASAVAYLHERGIRHRDIKPANLLIDASGAVKLVDFGLAMEADGSRLTRGDMSFGTVSYAPPEWIEPERLDPVLWDLYAIGVVFWESLTGLVAFPVSGEGSARQQAFQVILKKQNHPPLDPGPAYPEPLRALLGDLTHPDAQKRVADSASVVKRLEALGAPMIRLRSQTPVGPRPVPEPTLVPPERPPPGATFALEGNPHAPTPSAPTVPRVLKAPNPKPADIEVDDEEPPRRSGLAALGVVAVLLVLTVAVLAVGGVGITAMYLMSLGPQTREVAVRVTGLPEGTPYAMKLAGQAGTQAGSEWSFAGIPPEEVALAWAVGPGCPVPCIGPCPSYCLAGSRTLTVPPGSGTWETEVVLAPPAPRAVRLGTSDLPAGLPMAITVAGAEGGMEGRVWRGAAVQPGVYQARVVVGTCPPADPCEDTCPPGCRDVVREVTVPVGDGRVDATLVVSAPEPAAILATPPTGNGRDPRPPGPDRPADPPPSGRAGTLVSNSQYARWLAKNPDWGRDQAISNGLADDNYLFGWSADAPPPGQETRPVQYVPHLAARAYCQGRGGLPQIGDEPTTWDEGSVGLGFEWRLAGDAPASLESTGTSSTMVRRGQSLLGTGFRCKK